MRQARDGEDSTNDGAVADAAGGLFESSWRASTSAGRPMSEMPKRAAKDWRRPGARGVVVAGDDHDRATSARGHLLERVEEERLGAGGRVAAVRERRRRPRANRRARGIEQPVDLLEHRAVLVAAVAALERASQVPVGGVEDPHRPLGITWLGRWRRSRRPARGGFALCSIRTSHCPGLLEPRALTLAAPTVSGASPASPSLRSWRSLIAMS